ncbi:MAG: 50S ribosomal protein L35 [Candidatus Gracilibacteria bacterium]|jgi:ribosomal protein L35
MKQKSHSGLKKRLKIRKSGTATFEKSAKKHLLADKSKRQKKLYPSGMPINHTQRKSFAFILPGKLKTRGK